MNAIWDAYSRLAWTEEILAPPEDYAEESAAYYAAMCDAATRPIRTLLHFGCGAGGNDVTLSRLATITGVDCSPDMLAIARRRNPAITYIQDDMRTFSCDTVFDAVCIPDAIMHMTTVEDARAVIMTAAQHLAPGGVALIVTHLRDDFEPVHFVYTGAAQGIEITVFENDYCASETATTCDVTCLYIIRRDGKKTCEIDTCTCGLFSRATWESLFAEAGLTVTHTPLPHLYDTFVSGPARYILHQFIGRKAREDFVAEM